MDDKIQLCDHPVKRNLPLHAAHSVTQSCPTLCDRMDCSRQAPLSVALSRQEYWSGLPFPPPGDPPNPVTKPVSPVLAGGFFTTELPGKPILLRGTLERD